MSKTYDLKWHGDQVIRLSEEHLMAIMGEIGLTAEGESKKELRKGHGVKTGTLRRSIHTEKPDYNFAADDVEPGSGSPERGGKQVDAIQRGGIGRFVIALGSGLRYAMRVHQGWESFTGYHYLTLGVEKTKEKISSIVARHKVK